MNWTLINNVLVKFSEGVRRYKIDKVILLVLLLWLCVRTAFCYLMIMLGHSAQSL
jgi:hypothetical protein